MIYRIYLTYTDEIYLNDYDNTHFFLLNERKDFFESYSEAKKAFDKIMIKNEELIQLSKCNTFEVIELRSYIDENSKDYKLLKSRHYLW